MNETWKVKKSHNRSSKKKWTSCQKTSMAWKNVWPTFSQVFERKVCRYHHHRKEKFREINRDESIEHNLTKNWKVSKAKLRENEKESIYDITQNQKWITLTKITWKRKGIHLRNYAKSKMNHFDENYVKTKWNPFTILREIENESLWRKLREIGVESIQPKIREICSKLRSHQNGFTYSNLSNKRTASNNRTGLDIFSN